MPQRISQKIGWIIFTFGLVCIFVLGTQGVRGDNFSRSAMTAKAQTFDYKVFLPMALRPGITDIYGVETYSPHNESLMNRASEAGVKWVRYDAFHWATIEPVLTNPREYHWEVVNNSGLLEAAEHGFTVVATIKYTPLWAQQREGMYCGPIAEDFLDEFAQFVGELVTRYSVPPYNIKYWEFWNEPDVDPDRPDWDPWSVFGCWGDEEDTFYGGRYYAKMLEAVYPAVKAADPQSKVLNGGLLLDCDPSYSPDCKSGKFLDGILRYKNFTGGNYFDILSFHAYPMWIGTQFAPLDIAHPVWAHRGGIFAGKIDFLRDVLEHYGLDKPMLLTEGGLMGGKHSDGTYWSPSRPPAPEILADFFEQQAEYVAWLYVRSVAEGLLGSMWFTLEGPGWRYVGLMEYGEPRPDYDALHFLNQELNQAKYIRQLPSEDPDVCGYEFRTIDRWIWVVWVCDDAGFDIDRPFTLPSGVLTVYDMYGNVITPAGSEMTINAPIYIEWRP